MIIQTILFVTLFFFGCDKQLLERKPGIENPTNNEATSKKTSSIAEANNLFAFDLFSKLINNDENIFYSPLCLYSSLSLLYEGSQGETKSEIGRVLHISSDNTLFKDEYKALMTKLSYSNSDSSQLELANALWVQDGLQLDSEYCNNSKIYYRSSVENVDFINAPLEAINNINSWVTNKTNNTIKDILGPTDINELTSLIITNAIYFNSEWSDNFDLANTKKDVFYNNGNRIDSILFMNKRSNFRYGESDICQIIEIPFKMNGVSLTIFLPKEKTVNDISGLIENCKEFDLLTGLQFKNVNLSIPKFELNTTYTLTEYLKSLGMGLSFSQNADFTGMVKNEQLFVSLIKQKAYLKFNEEEVEASASTMTMMLTGSAGYVGEDEIIDFIADHPYLFLIKHNDIILFMGVINNSNNVGRH